ncbi:ATP-binding protein [Aureibacillus halotolerans]|uniref:DNA replication protein DnaC n=1 Tax=Aureibacillus halotolerans TaxID=1508390 RepID=A0A4V3D4D7_9BACI|nr:ATP-binding protein [Aureibacillus halotolerans]TDQ35248.1 DNA replication protein DnaC [Aureibacillus halotolerans]
MKSLQETKIFRNPANRVLEEFVCERCKRHVKRMEMVIPVGPRKGEKVVNDMGCKCEDIQLAKESQERYKRLKQQKKLEVFDRFSLMNKDLEDASFDNYNPGAFREQYEVARQYAREFPKNDKINLFFQGSFGTGKSHLSASIKHEVQARGFTTILISVPRLFTQIKSSWSHKEFTEADVMEALATVDLLIVDDLGAEDSDANWGSSKLFETLDQRAGRHTIYTTNLGKGEMTEDKKKARRFSRLMGKSQIVVMNGEDYRMKDLMG